MTTIWDHPPTDEEIRADCQEDVDNVGRCMGENRYVAFFWDIYLLEYHEDMTREGNVLTFKIGSEDVDLFPELEGRKEVRLYLVGVDANGIPEAVKEIP